MSSGELGKVEPAMAEIVKRFLRQKPVPLGAMARELGLKVKLSALGPGKSGSIGRVGDHYVIKINRYETRERQRFTLAHEISHFLLHRDLIDRVGEIEDNVLYRSGQPENVEFEANRLAAELVMPSEILFEEIENLAVPVTDDVIEKFARQWQVSKAAMEIKLSPISA